MHRQAIAFKVNRVERLHNVVVQSADTLHRCNERFQHDAPVRERVIQAKQKFREWTAQNHAVVGRNLAVAVLIHEARVARLESR